MGFIRSTQRQPLSKGEAVTLAHFTIEKEIATLLREQDPFGCDDACPQQPAGHYLVQSAGDVVCAYCEKVFWR